MALSGPTAPPPHPSWQSSKPSFGASMSVTTASRENGRRYSTSALCAASAVDDGQEEFHEAQLCVLLAAIVCLEERTRLIRDVLVATGVVAAVLLTWGDTVSDVDALAVLFEA